MFRAAATLLLAAFLLCQNAHAQTTQDSIKQTINQLFTAIKDADAASLQACFADSALLQTVIHKDGKTIVRSAPVSEFAASIAKMQKGDADEQVTYDVIKSDAELAMVWAPYKFYYKGKFSHCGTDSFQLIRINGAWKIQYIIDTRRNENCE